MSTLRWGVIGCGAIASDFVAALLAHAKHSHEIVAAAARSLDRAREFLASHSRDKAIAYGSYEELLGDANVDIVYIANMNHSHLPWTLAALDAGKHVLCEKSIACNVDEIEKIIAKAKSAKRFVMEAIWTRFQPSWLKVADVISSKQLGEAKVFHANFGVCLPPGRRVLEHGESPITDIGIYAVQAALHVFGDETPIAVDVVGEKDEHGVDKWANITLRFNKDRHAFVYFNGNTHTPNTAFVAFERGQVLIESPFWCAKKLTLRENNVKEEKQLDFTKDDSTSYVYTNSDLLVHEADHCYERIQAGCVESDVLPLEASLRIHKILEQVRHSLGVKYAQDA